MPDLDWLSIDNIGCIGDASQQHLLFDLYNRARQANVNIIVSGMSLPSGTANDERHVKTRLNLATVFQLETLNDEQTKEALNNQMSERNMSIDEKVYSYLFKHYSRDIRQCCLRQLIDWMRRQCKLSKALVFRWQRKYFEYLSY